MDRAEFVINSMLVRKDFYSYTRIFSEYYAPADNKAKLYMRQFYNEDGSIAYNEYIDGDSSIYVFEDAVLYNKTEFIAYFLQRLNLTRDDIVILDRASDIGQAVLQHKGDSKVGVVIHADHYSNNMMSEQHILWNNYYEYQFRKLNTLISLLQQQIFKIIWFVDNSSNIKVTTHVSILFRWEALMRYHIQHYQESHMR